MANVLKWVRGTCCAYCYVRFHFVLMCYDNYFVCCSVCYLLVWLLLIVLFVNGYLFVCLLVCLFVSSFYFALRYLRFLLFPVTVVDSFLFVVLYELWNYFCLRFCGLDRYFFLLKLCRSLLWYYVLVNVFEFNFCGFAFVIICYGYCYYISCWL